MQFVIKQLNNAAAFIKLSAMTNDQLNKLIEKNDIKLTDLRKDVLAILLQKHKPMGAYDVLEKLRKKRPNAEPPTVYRVLDFLVEAKLVHRIESQNAFVCCSHIDDQKTAHQTLLLICKSCQHSFEYTNPAFFRSINQFADKNSISIDSDLIEIKGTCKKCLR